MDNMDAGRTSASHSARLDRSLLVLQDRVKEHEIALEKLRASTPLIETKPSLEPAMQIKQLRVLRAAYESLTPKEPYLPSPDSPLPALLALRITSRCIKETQDCILESDSRCQKIQHRILNEQADLGNAHLIQRGLETRIMSLQGEIDERTQKSPGQIVKDLMKELRKRKKQYDVETGKLVKTFNSFIDDHLAAMLAVEELGGPIVGEILDVDDDMLQAGFSTQGKTKNLKGNFNEDKQQLRIDEIWGSRPSSDGRAKEPWNEKQAAAAEMRDLTEQLLNSLVEADSGGPGAYVELQRESAAARFLVRSKVAQFHPKDARRLRLLDFGGDIDE